MTNGDGMLQIGEVAGAVGLSIRTIRHYDELGIVEPSGRSPGGFRLYTDVDVERLRLVKQLKPLQFSLEEIQELVETLDLVRTNRADGSDIDRLAAFAVASEERCEQLRAQLRLAEGVAEELRRLVPAPTRRRR